MRLTKPKKDGDFESSKDVSYRDTVDVFKNIANNPSKKLFKEGKQISFKDLMQKES